MKRTDYETWVLGGVIVASVVGFLVYPPVGAVLIVGAILYGAFLA